MPLQVIRHDITKVKADAIVNTANPEPIYAGGTDKAVYEAAGVDRLLAERKKIGKIAKGEVAVTEAFDLKAKYIIHTVGPAWEGGDKGEFDILRSCYEKSLEKALELKCKSVAFPLIATGVYGFPKDKALKIATQVIQSFVMEHDIQVYLVVFNPEALELSDKVFGKIKAYVDDNYVEDAYVREYDLPEGSRDILTDDRAIMERRYARHLRELEIEGKTEEVIANESIWAKPGKSKAKYKSKSLKDRVENTLEEGEKTFQERFFELQDEKGIKNSKVYNDACITKAAFSKMQCNRDYQPKKNNAILFCLILKLSLEETEDLLRRAGYSLNPSSKSDMIVKACINYGVYEIYEVEKCLVSLGCKPLRREPK